ALPDAADPGPDARARRGHRAARHAGSHRHRFARQRDRAPCHAGGMNETNGMSEAAAGWILVGALAFALPAAAAWLWLVRARQAERLHAETRLKLEQLQREFERFA